MTSRSLSWLREEQRARNTFTDQTFDALIATIVGSIWLRKLLGVDFIPTEVLSSDSLERLFSHCRSLGGTSTNHTLFKMQFIFVHIYRRLELVHGFCELDPPWGPTQKMHLTVNIFSHRPPAGAQLTKPQ